MVKAQKCNALRPTTAEVWRPGLLFTLAERVTQLCRTPWSYSEQRKLADARRQRLELGLSNINNNVFRVLCDRFWKYQHD